MTQSDKDALMTIINTLFTTEEAARVYKVAKNFSDGKAAARYVVEARVSLDKLKALDANVSPDFYTYMGVVKEYQSWKYPLVEWDYITEYALAMKWIGDEDGFGRLAQELKQEMNKL